MTGTAPENLSYTVNTLWDRGGNPAWSLSLYFDTHRPAFFPCSLKWQHSCTITCCSSTVTTNASIFSIHVSTSVAHFENLQKGLTTYRDLSITFGAWLIPRGAVTLRSTQLKLWWPRGLCCEGRSSCPPNAAERNEHVESIPLSPSTVQ